MLSTAHGLRIELTELRQRFSISLKGGTLAQAVRHAQALGFVCRAVRTELDGIQKLQLPCMLHWNLNHFVVLTKVSGKKITILDPAVGKRVMTLADASPHFTGVALELTPTAAFKPADLRRKIRLRDLVGRIFGLKRALLSIVLLAVGLETIAIAMPLITQWVVDGALVSGDKDVLLLTLLGGGALMLTQFMLSMSRGWVALSMNQQLAVQFTANLFNHLLKLPIAFFEKRHVGDIVSRFNSLNAIRAVLTESSVSAVVDGVMALVTLTMLALYSVKLLSIVLIALSLYGLLRWVSFSALRSANEERIALSAKENTYFLETIRAVQSLKLFNRTPERLGRWQNLMVDVQNRELITQRMELGFANANTLIFGVEGMLILYLGGAAVLAQQMTLGMLLAFIAYKVQFTQRSSALINLLMQVKMLGLHAERLADIALEKPEAEAAIETDVSRLQPRIEVRNVSFRYADGEPWVLKDCTLTIEPGEHIAICGPSGCGKSTLLKLMLGILTPNEGDIRIGGVSLKQLGPTQYRSLIAAVMQSDALLAGSLAENIACFDPAMRQDGVANAATLAQVHDDICAMPMGYQTLVGDMGSSLSGGQRQRVLLARALYAQPKILALDEATSSLDAENEQRVNEAVKALPLTRITIAHRRETINAARRVVVLGEGRVIRDVRAA